MSGATLLVGDALTVLRTLPDGAARCCVTSPPYFGLRDYGTGTWEGGDAACQHRVGRQVQDSKAPGAITTGQRPGVDASRCKGCGAVRVDQQLGLESTPDAYVARMVEVLREVRRVLADDGTLWLNLADSYANDAKWGGSSGGKHVAALHGNTGVGRGKKDTGLKAKDLIGVPWRVAFALQADGWYLRSDIIWHKPNPMPESVRDRPTKAHEYVFLLSKSERYYYDAGAVAEPATFPDGSGNVQRKVGEERGRPGSRLGGSIPWEGSTRNARTVWTVATKPYAGAHFATMPPELAERCVLAGSAPGDTVLDPFGGSGTTAAVAVGHGRKAIHIDLNAEYHQLARERIGPMLCNGNGEAA